MEHLDLPSSEVWEFRRQWFEDTNERYAEAGNYFVSEQACALVADVQSSFCAGAWVAVLILSMIVVDAQLRETECPGFTGNTKDLILEAQANPILQKLRLRRNSLVHAPPESPAITVDQQWSDRVKLEEEARVAVELMFEAFYIGPWT